MDNFEKVELITAVMLILIITILIALAIKYKILVNNSNDQDYVAPSQPPQPNPPRPNPPRPNPPPSQPKPPQPNPPQVTPSQPNPFPLFTPANTPSNNIVSKLCSPTPDTNWYGPLDDLSTDPQCVCRSNEKILSRTMNGSIYYKCELNN